MQIGLETKLSRQYFGGRAQRLERWNGCTNVIVHNRLNIVAWIVHGVGKAVRQKTAVHEAPITPAPMTATME